MSRKTSKGRSERQAVLSAAEKQVHQVAGSGVLTRAVESQALSLGSGGDEHGIPTNFKYYQSDHQCLSEWEKAELRGLSSLIRKLSQMTWVQVGQSGGTRGGKTGLGLTKHRDRKALPQCDALDRLSEDLAFFELRVTEKARVHGFRVGNAFCLVWLDRNHEIYPE